MNKHNRFSFLSSRSGHWLLILLLVSASSTTVGVFAYQDFSLMKANQASGLNTTNNPLSMEEEPLQTQSSINHLAMLFGTVNTTSNIIKNKKIPETKLNLTLKGTFTHQESKKASALIAEAKKKASRYYVGEKVPGGAELLSVNPGEVILRRNGQDELLRLPILKGEKQTLAENSRPVNHQSTAYNSPVSSKTPPPPSTEHQQRLKERLTRLRNSRVKTEQ